jgi:hypothetical protein
MIYQRVIPRDLFNEAKLLKCIGRLVLLIHDGDHNNISFEHDGEPFEIYQNQDDGSLSIENIYFSIGEDRLSFYTNYNSKLNYPLFCTSTQDGETYSVFDEHGNYEPEFIEYCQKVTKAAY